MVKQKKTKEELITPVKSSDQKSKPTPEQMRIAQILDKKVVDSSIKTKLKQIMDATQRSADEVYVALHDSDFDVNRAVDLLIEGDSLADWCTNEKKKKKLQELRDKKTEETPIFPEPKEEVVKVTRNPSFRGRGGDRRIPGRGRSSNFAERRQRGNTEESTVRGRGSQGRGRRGSRPPTGGTMVFERSNVQDTSDPGSQPSVAVRNRWERPLVQNNPEEDWDTEEFTGSLSQTQIFTSSVKTDKVGPSTSEELKKTSIPAGITAGMSGSPPPAPLSVPLPLSNTQQSLISSPLIKREVPQPEVRTAIITHSNSPPESHSDYLYRLSSYATKPENVVPNREEKKPAATKIPTSAVEMPPDMKPSLSFLDIQFGAMDLGPSACEANSGETHSTSSQNSSTTTLMPLSSIHSSGSMTQLMANNSISSCTSASNLISSNCISNATSGNSVVTPTTIPPVTGVNHLLTTNSIPSGGNVNHMIPHNSGPNISHMMGPNSINSGPAHLLGHSSMTSSSQTPQTRFASSQSLHLPYSFITPQTGGSAHQFESRPHETNTSIPPPHMAQPQHLPPFKQTPPGVPKGAIMANIPPGQLVGNQFIVGQGPYFPQPIYYYEEVPPVMNNQQRLTHHMSSGYDVSYQPSTPSTRDGVHYNV